MTSERSFIFTMEVLSAIIGLIGLVTLSIGLYRIVTPGGTNLELIYTGFGATIAAVSSALFLVCHRWSKRLR
jgi:hypothetical protein